MTKKVFKFSTDINDFNRLRDWVMQICAKYRKTATIMGYEPTGHYWFIFHQLIEEHSMKLVFVNHARVKKIKEQDTQVPQNRFKGS